MVLPLIDREARCYTIVSSCKCFRVFPWAEQNRYRCKFKRRLLVHLSFPSSFSRREAGTQGSSLQLGYAFDEVEESCVKDDKGSLEIRQIGDE